MSGIAIVKHPAESSVETLFAVLIMITGYQFKKDVYAVLFKIPDNLHSVSLYRLESLHVRFCLLIAEQEVCLPVLFRDRLGLEPLHKTVVPE